MGEPLTSLVEMNRIVNRQQTDHHYRMILGGSMLWTKGYLGNESPNIGPDSHVQLNENGDVGFIEADPQVSALVESINNYLRLFLLSRRIPESAVMAVQSGESGIKVMADQTALADYRKDRAGLFRPWEEELIRMELFVWSIHNGRSVRWEDVPPRPSPTLSRRSR
jgi:hypothetical protein